MKSNSPKKQYHLKEESRHIPKEYFYKRQLEERESIIDELKIVLELTESKLRMSEENKIKLESQIKEYKERMKRMNLI